MASISVEYNESIYVLVDPLLGAHTTAFCRRISSSSKPLAKEPGPRLAAITGCYEMYYDLVKKATFPWKIVELHEQYGSSLGTPILDEAIQILVKNLWLTTVRRSHCEDSSQ